MFEPIHHARERLRGNASSTTAMASRSLDREVGVRVSFTCESFERIGAFEFRGAFDTIARLSEEERGQGAIMFSWGNHSQTVGPILGG
jgi:threonine dehydratase